MILNPSCPLSYHLETLGEAEVDLPSGSRGGKSLSYQEWFTLGPDQEACSMPGMTLNLQWVQGGSIDSTQGYVQFREGFLAEEALKHRLHSVSHRMLGKWLS